MVRLLLQYRNPFINISLGHFLTKKGIIIVCKNPSIRNITEDGKIDRFSELTMSILSLMATFSKNLQKESQMEGIRLRKEKKLYTGRRVGTVDSPERLLMKGRSRKILDYLSKGTYSYSEISKIIGCSPTTIVKVKKVSQMVSNWVPVSSGWRDECNESRNNRIELVRNTCCWTICDHRGKKYWFWIGKTGWKSLTGLNLEG